MSSQTLFPRSQTPPPRGSLFLCIKISILNSQISCDAMRHAAVHDGVPFIQAPGGAILIYSASLHQ